MTMIFSGWSERNIALGTRCAAFLAMVLTLSLSAGQRLFSQDAVATGSSAAEPSGAQSSGAKSLEEKVDEFFAQPHFKNAHIGLLFVDLESGEVVLERNREKLFAPASTTKLFTVAAALDALGADYRFRTPVHYRGKLQDGVLEGDLILVASGDLSFGGRTNEKGEIALVDSDHTYANWATDAGLTPQDPLAGVHDLARQIAASGIRRINGDVLIDDRLFDHSQGSGSGPDYVTPIMINDNVIDFHIEPTEPGKPAKVTWRPQTALFKVDVQLDTGTEKEPLETWIRPQAEGGLILSGKIPANKRSLVRIYAVPDPAAFARALLIESLRTAGIEVKADLKRQPASAALPQKDAYANLPKVAELVSPPFGESARLILKVSHNLHASALPLLIAADGGERNLKEGLALERDFLARAGVEADTISFGGGAGGSRADYVTPHATVQLLKHMAGRPDFAVYKRALPILGIDGTLAAACPPNSPAKGKVFAKTGTLVWENTLNDRGLLTSKALAGYLTTAKGKQMAFALFVNGVHLKDGLDTKRIGIDLAKVCEMVHVER